MNYFYEILLVCAVISTMMLCLFCTVTMFSIRRIAVELILRNNILKEIKRYKQLDHFNKLQSKYYSDEARRD